ncbi:hypothetical protein ACHQM5_017297 [Ranunculus cassubicifolius]
MFVFMLIGSVFVSILRISINNALFSSDFTMDNVYVLYTYGFGKGDIGRLCIAGFGSSMLFGTIVGSLADKTGRKRACVTYCITYILSCATKHSPQYKILMVGRILGGIATSLLFSSFESWLIAEHNKRNFEQQWLSITFSKAIFFGNGLVAILAGLFGNVLADTLGFGPVASFDAAVVFLAIGMAIILSSWNENFGDPSESKDLLTQFKAFKSLFLNLFLIYFILLATPNLVAPSEVRGEGITFAGCVQVLGFCTFESCVGIFRPSIMKMRSQYIPEAARSTIMNFFRIPLNIFVCIVLYNVNAFPITVMFGMCSIFLFMAAILQRRLLVVADIHRTKSQEWTSMKERDTEEEPLNV